MKNSAVASAFLTAALLGLVACTPAKEDQPPKPKVSGTPAGGMTMAAAQPAEKLPNLGVAPAWQLADPAGKNVAFEQFKGKVVVVDFWATWCGPCKAEIPGYIALQQKYGKDGFVIVGVSMDQAGPDVVKSFSEKTGINYPVVMADEKISAAFGGIEVLPTTFLIDRSGQIRDRKEGTEETAEYEKKVTALLGEKA